MTQPYVKEALADAGNRDRPRVRLIGRLAPGAGPQAAEAAMRSVDAEVRREFPRDSAPAGALKVAVAGGATMPAAREVATRSPRCCFPLPASCC